MLLRFSGHEKFRIMSRLLQRMASIRNLDPIVGTSRPEPAANEAAVRIFDVQLVLDTCIATQEKRRGARRRVARKHRISPSTVTEAVKRFERAMGVTLFGPCRGDGEDSLTNAGSAFTGYGRKFLESYHLLRKFLQETNQDVKQE